MGPTFRRTRKGQEELVLAQHGLPESKRNILLYANGNRSMDELKRLIPEVKEAPDILTAMQELGFLELYDPEVGQVDSPQATSSRPNSGRKPQTSVVERSNADNSRSSALEGMKREIIDDLTNLLGDDSRKAIAKVESIENKEDLLRLLPRLRELVKLYSGARRADEFYRRYINR